MGRSNFLTARASEMSQQQCTLFMSIVFAFKAKFMNPSEIKGINNFLFKYL